MLFIHCSGARKKGTLTADIAAQFAVAVFFLRFFSDRFTRAPRSLEVEEVEAHKERYFECCTA